MAWHLTDDAGPFTAPWEGKDAVGWVWEILNDDETESRRVLVEVSGTAMAVADEFLPRETADAKNTEGRSEVEKVLGEVDPPRRITLGTTGYMGESSPRPDLVLVDAAGKPVATVEVRNPSVLTLPEASVVRDRFAEYIRARFFLIVSQTRGFLFDQETQEYPPAAEFEMIDVVRRYYPPATEHQRFKGTELELIVQQWLRDLTHGDPPDPVPAEVALRDAGFLDAVRDAVVSLPTP